MLAISGDLCIQISELTAENARLTAAQNTPGRVKARLIG